MGSTSVVGTSKKRRSEDDLESQIYYRKRKYDLLIPKTCLVEINISTSRVQKITSHVFISSLQMHSFFQRAWGCGAHDGHGIISANVVREDILK